LDSWEFFQIISSPLFSRGVFGFFTFAALASSAAAIGVFFHQVNRRPCLRIAAASILCAACREASSVSQSRKIGGFAFIAGAAAGQVLHGVSSARSV
jgi:hypothetical protein